MILFPSIDRPQMHLKYTYYCTFTFFHLKYTYYCTFTFLHLKYTYYCTFTFLHLKYTYYCTFTFLHLKYTYYCTFTFLHLKYTYYCTFTFFTLNTHTTVLYIRCIHCFSLSHIVIIVAINIHTFSSDHRRQSQKTKLKK